MSRSRHRRGHLPTPCGTCHNELRCVCVPRESVAVLCATVDTPQAIAFEASEPEPYDYDDDDWCPYCDRTVFIGALGRHFDRCLSLMAEGGYNIHHDPITHRILLPPNLTPTLKDTRKRYDPMWAEDC